MVKTRIAPRPEEVRQSAQHCLFVEGEGESGFDVQVLRELLKDTDISIKPLGPSHYITAAAEALHTHHPDYYFLIDRDHHEERSIKKSWENFPDETQSNLLIWRRRELESYFLIPEYLAKSKYLNCSPGDLKRRILAQAEQRVFLDIANLTIIEIRERLKRNWIEIFSGSTGFETRETALDNLLQRPEFESKKNSDLQILGVGRIEARFNRLADQFLGAPKKLQFGKGTWLEMIKPKPVLNSIVDRSFRVLDARKREVLGAQKVIEVAKSLVRLPLEEQPDDFQELHRLISERVERR